MLSERSHRSSADRCFFTSTGAGAMSCTDLSTCAVSALDPALLEFKIKIAQFDLVSFSRLESLGDRLTLPATTGGNRAVYEEQRCRGVVSPKFAGLMKSR